MCLKAEQTKRLHSSALENIIKCKSLSYILYIFNIDSSDSSSAAVTNMP